MKPSSRLFALCVAAALLYGSVSAQQPQGKGEGSVGPKPSLTVTTVAAESAVWSQTLPATGTISAWQDVAIGAEVGGQRLARLLVDAGDRVKKGQLLALMSVGTLQAELAASRAALAEAQAHARESVQSAARVRRLQGSDALSDQAIDQALAAEEAALARVASARARVQGDKLRLSYTRIVAPADGLISSRSATEGALVQVGQELFRLQRQGRLEWRAEVPGAELAKLRAGQLAKLQPGGGASVDGRLRRVAPLVDSQSRKGTVYVDLSDVSGLRAGQFARGEISIGESRVLTLPQNAVLLRDGFSYVFKLDADSRVRQHKVEVGRRQQGRIEIKEGLQVGERVAADGVGFLADGDVVRVQN